MIVAIAVLCAVLLQSEDVRGRAAQLYRERKFAEAAILLEQHVAAHPQDLSSRLLLGVSHQLNGDLPRAEDAFRTAVDRWPDHAGARHWLARVLYLRGRLVEAEPQARAALERGEPAARVHTLLGLIRVEQHRFEAALQELRTGMLEASGQYVEPFVQAGILLLKLNRAEEALRVLDEAVSRDPRSSEAARQRERAQQALHAKKPPPSAPPEPIRLREIARAAGIDFTLENSATPAKHLIETMPGGIAVFDFDADELPDIYFTNGAALPSLQKTDAQYFNRLYRNMGGLRFQDVTVDAGVAGRGYSMGAAAADFDNDGHVDLFVAGVRSNILYRNHGQGKFEDVTAQAGITSADWSAAGAWLDYDRDGLLDLFVVNYLDWRLGKEPYCGDETKGFRVYCHPKHFGGTTNRLYRNTGDGRFEDVSQASRISAHIGKGALRRNSTASLIYAAFLNTTNSVLVAAMR